MKTNRCLVPALFIGLGLAAGCDLDEGEGDLGAVSLRPGTGSQGGVWLNTSAIGTQPFSEIDLTGQVHDGIRFTGLLVALPNNQFVPAMPEVTAGNLSARVGATVYSGAALIGSRWQIDLVDGFVETPVELVITSHTQITPQESRYSFETLNEQGVLTNICAPDLHGNSLAIPVGDLNVDDATGDMGLRGNTLYLACMSGAVGKAIDWGYGPWERTLPEFELATRMVRADYCLDGMSWTTDGTGVQVKDKWGTNNFLRASDPNEVVWTRLGVACLNQPRAATYSAAQVTCDGQPLPPCATDTTLNTYVETLFWTKVDAPQ